MINLKPLTTCTHFEFDQIHESKNEPIYSVLTDIREEVRERYNEFNQLLTRNKLEEIGVSHFEGNNKAALQSCYESPVLALNDLKVRIKKNQPELIKGICQYCGMDSDRTFDHYLPKEHFPDLNVNHQNLLPCCPTCNQLKHDYWLDSRNNQRGIINFYTDKIPDIQFLFVDITIIDGLPVGRYSIKNDEEKIDPYFYQTIENHFRKLSLILRYNERFSNSFNRVLSSIRPLIKARLPIKQFRSLLDAEVEKNSEDFGINQYMTVIKKKMSDDEELLQRIIEAYN